MDLAGAGGCGWWCVVGAERASAVGGCTTTTQHKHNRGAQQEEEGGSWGRPVGFVGVPTGASWFSISRR
eukprot:scaffold49128_cov78-Cyclotella_meneghiniana.AAC.5